MIREALDAYAESAGRTWQTDRSQTVGASEIGLCARRVFFLKNEGDVVYGATRDEDHEDGWGARIRGSVYEDAWWVPAMRARFGDRLLYAGNDQRTLVDGFLSATPDGVLVGMPNDALLGVGIPDLEADCVVVDCKTIDPRARIDEPKPEHAYQLQVQIGLVRLRTNHRPVYGVLPYTNASIWSEVTEFAIRFDPAVFEHAQERATMIMTARSAADLLPEGHIAGGKECDLCPFTRPCGILRAERVPSSADPIDDEARDAIVDLARQAKLLKLEGEAAALEARRLEEQVRAAMAEAGTRKTAAPDVSVVWSSVKGRTSWDMDGLTEAASAAGIDVDSFKTDGPPSDRLVITLKGEPKATKQ